MVHAMYQCLVNYTGAVPAEFYSIKKRPVGWMKGCLGMYVLLDEWFGWVLGWMVETQGSCMQSSILDQKDTTVHNYLHNLTCTPASRKLL